MKSLPRFSVENPILINLLMLTILVGGVYSAVTLVREMFPEVTPDRVLISTVYPGATPAEVEKGISIKIEEAIRNIDGIDELNTTIGEGFSTITAVLFHSVEDVDQVVTEIKAAIDALPREDFPADAEETRVTKFEPKIPVINVAFFGNLSDKTLKETGNDLRDELLAIPGITNVVLQGTRQDEISVELRPGQLNRFGLSFMDVADAIRRANLDLPAGQLKTGTANVSVRTLGEKDEADAIGRIIVRSDPSGKVLRINDVATVLDGFEEADVVSRFNAKPGINLTIFKSADQDAIEISKKVQAYVAGKMGQPLERNWLGRLADRLGLPDGIRRVYENAAAVPCPLGGRLQTSTNLARFIEGRLDLLKRNGAWGLTFVFLSLLIFLNWRVALWVMMGLLLAILGTLIVMNIMGLTLNLISMFGLIIVLGLLVDDAIIVGEHVFTRFENGMEPKLAAVTGTEAVTWPVVCTIITTIVAFAPLLFIKGVIGDFMGVLPVIVMCALIVSLFESLSILPAHLATGLQRGMPLRSELPGGVGAPDPASMGWARAWAVRFRTTQNLVLRKKLLDGYEWLLRRAVSHRYVTMAALASVLIIALGFVVGGRVPVVFVQKMDSETLLANLKMPVGAPIDRTDEAVQVVERAAMDLPELESMYTIIGMQYNEQGGDTGAASHLGQIIIELKSVEQRQRTSEDILRELRSKTVAIPGMNSLKFNSMQGGPGGAAIQVEITGGGAARESDLVEVADHIKSELQRYAGVFDIQDDFDAGRREIQIELLESARALGITTESLATQVRAAFYGLEARKIQRRREDVKIMVRYPESARRRVYDVESMWIAAPDSTLVPFSEVARLKEGRSYASIKRKNQERTVTVTADVDQAVGNARIITADLARGFSVLQRKFPGMQIEFGGQAREFARAFSSLRRDFVIAGLLIYVILAGLFKSYVQPLIVMATIPFGLIGAVAGHYVMGYPLTIMSLIGLVALTGIVVNDSLILVDFINRRRGEGAGIFEAIIDGGRQRLRAIMLTSITTVAGLAPLLMEESFQARFLIPMGISIAAGVAFATVLTLVAVPSLYMIVEDFKKALDRVRSAVGLSELRIAD